jgi:signal peptidase II
MGSAVDSEVPGAERRVFLWAAAGTVILDLITKLIAEATLLRTPGISVFGDWFQLRLVYNQGAAFGLHVGPYSRWIFFTVALVAVFVLARMSRTSPVGDRFRQLALGLVAGGAVGNLIDRVRSPRGVVDFLDVGCAGPHSTWRTSRSAAVLSRWPSRSGGKMPGARSRSRLRWSE